MRGEPLNPSIVYYIDSTLNTLKCSLRISNNQVLEQSEELEKIKKLKFNVEPLC